jgi:hypothetical protein
MGVEHGGGGAPEREPTPSEAKRPENNQPTLEVGEGRGGVPPPQGEPAKPQQEGGNAELGLPPTLHERAKPPPESQGLPTPEQPGEGLGQQPVEEAGGEAIFHADQVRKRLRRGLRFGPCGPPFD